MSTSPRWKQRPPGSNWGDFGPDDQFGRMNLLTAEKVKQGVAEVHEGLSFCLSLPLNLPGGNLINPRRHPPLLRPTVRANRRPNMNYRLMQDNPNHSDVISDDLVVMHLQYSTQWDSFAHVGQMFDANADGLPEAVYYNGYRADEHILGPSDPADAGVPAAPGARSSSIATKLGIENLALKCAQGRAAMIDLEKHFGRDRRNIGYDDLMRVLDADRIEVESGDMVCLHTGFAQMLIEMDGTPDIHLLENSCCALDGRDSKLLQWITDSGLIALIADNYAVETHPALAADGCCATLPIHEHCLFKLGIHLGEIWHLTPLASWLREHRRYRFLLTAPPLRLPGAVGSPATPVATV